MTLDENHLRNLASRHVHYEVARLVDYAVSLCSRYPPDGYPGADRFQDSPCDDAMLEATLVHIRLLDDFLGSSKDPRDAHACDWLMSWSRTGYLAPADRRRISKQVAHLDKDRATSFEGNIRRHTIDCLTMMQTFLNELEQESALRARTFDETRNRIDEGLAALGTAADDPPEQPSFN